MIDSPAQLRAVLKRRDYSELEILELVLGDWLRNHFLGPLNVALTAHRARVHRGTRKSYNPVDYNHLLAFFLRRFISSLSKNKKHNISSLTLESLESELMGKKRAKVLNACFALGPQQVEDILSSLSSYLLKWILPGATACVDETVFPYYGKMAFDAGLLQKIPGKPYDYGLVSYLIAQPLLLSGLPVCLGVAATWAGPPPSPIEASLILLRRLDHQLIIHFGSRHLVADSLWSHPAHLDRFDRENVLYTVAVKATNSALPSGLYTLASEDLPALHARTYSNGSLVFQIYNEGDSVTGVLSNAWEVPGQATPTLHQIGKYKTAQYLFRHESVSSLVAMFRLSEEYLKESKVNVIFTGTGWDVLRPREKQGDSGPLTIAEAREMSKESLLTIHQQVHRKHRAAKSMTKEELLLDLFPEADGEPPKKKKKHSLADLLAQRAEVRGSATPQHQVIDHWGQHWNLVDRINEDHHNYYHLPGSHSALKHGMESVVFLATMTARAIWEEHRRERAYASSNRRKQAVESVSKHTIPQFIVAAAEQFVQSKK